MCLWEKQETPWWWHSKSEFKACPSCTVRHRLKCQGVVCSWMEKSLLSMHKSVGAILAGPAPLENSKQNTKKNQQRNILISTGQINKVWNSFISANYLGKGKHCTLQHWVWQLYNGLECEIVRGSWFSYLGVALLSTGHWTEFSLPRKLAVLFIWNLRTVCVLACNNRL